MQGTTTALCAAITIDNDGADAPEWLHLLPAGEVRTVDGRGPYRVADTAALMAASMRRGKLALDENHATDLAAPQGLSAPARAWIVELQSRADGIWGRVAWTDDGRRLVSGYRGISPVIAHSKDGTITAILRASLTNTPNLAGLQSLHSQENDMDFRKLLIEAMGLDGEPDDAAIMAALKAKMEMSDKADVPAALQSALAPIAAAAGVPAGSDAAAVLAGVQLLKAGATDTAVVIGLQSELAATACKLNELIDGTSRKDAVAFVDAAIAAGRVGVKPMRDRYIAMHMADAAGTEELIGAMPSIKGGATLGRIRLAEAKDGLGEADEAVMSLMGLDRAAYLATHTEHRQEML